MGGTCSKYRGEKSCVSMVLVGKPEGMRPLGRPRCRWEFIIKMNFHKWDVEAWTGMIWLSRGGGGVASTCECGNEHAGSIKCGEFDLLGNC
jgi:hypothetical protein